AKAATHRTAPTTMRLWRSVAPSVMSLRSAAIVDRQERTRLGRRLGGGAADRRGSQRCAVLAAARQKVERGQLHGGGVVEAELARCQRRDAFRTGDPCPFRLEQADCATFRNDVPVYLRELAACDPRAFRHMVERENRKTHQRYEEEIQDTDHGGPPYA